MKVVKLAQVRDRIKDLVQEANFELQKDVLQVINELAKKEESPAGKEVFNPMIDNAKIAREEKLGLCQDTGLAVLNMHGLVAMFWAISHCQAFASANGSARSVARHAG